MTSRRFFSKALLTPLLFCVEAMAATPDATETARNPFRTVNIAGDSKNVVYFFDFSCPFCSKYHLAFAQWMTTVPKGITATFIPVVNQNDTRKLQQQIISAKCFYAASEVGTRQQVADFMTSVYTSYANGQPLGTKEIWMEAVKFSKINQKAFTAALQNKSSDLQIRMAATRVAQYDLASTPSVAIGGRYVLTPDDVNGNEEMFFNILNGLTSRAL